MHIWRVANTQTVAAAVSGEIRVADPSLEQDNLWHDPDLVVRLREKVEKDTCQSNPKRLIYAGNLHAGGRCLVFPGPVLAGSLDRRR